LRIVQGFLLSKVKSHTIQNHQNFSEQCCVGLLRTDDSDQFSKVSSIVSVHSQFDSALTDEKFEVSAVALSVDDAASLSMQVSHEHTYVPPLPPQKPHVNNFFFSTPYSVSHFSFMCLSLSLFVCLSVPLSLPVSLSLCPYSS